MRYRRPRNHSIRHAPEVRARNVPGPPRTAPPYPATGPLPHSPGRPVQGFSPRSPAVPPGGPPNAWAQARRALLTAGCVAGVAGGIVLVVRSVGTSPLLVAGLVLAVLGTLIRSRQVAERVLAAVMVVLLAPLLLATGLAVRLTSPGPALVRPVGAVGRTTPTLRFRTTFAAGQSRLVTGAGTEYTPLGRLLHRSGLDELPGLLDGVRGNMPLFWPRSR